MILLDTNVLGRLADSTDPQHVLTVRAVHVLLRRDERLGIVPQNLYEFWAVATRLVGPPPIGQNGLGMAPKQAGQWLRFFQRRFTVLFDQQELLSRWHELVELLEVKSFRAHDARLVAAMQTYGITRLLTFNGAHFKGFPITVVEPASV